MEMDRRDYDGVHNLVCINATNALPIMTMNDDVPTYVSLDDAWADLRAKFPTVPEDLGRLIFFCGAASATLVRANGFELGPQFEVFEKEAKATLVRRQ